MSTDRPMPTDTATRDHADCPDPSVRRLSFGRVFDSSAVQGITDLAMVSLIGGGPRVAVRAARVFLEDSYASRSGKHEM